MHEDDDRYDFGTGDGYDEADGDGYDDDPDDADGDGFDHEAHAAEDYDDDDDHDDSPEPPDDYFHETVPLEALSRGDLVVGAGIGDMDRHYCEVVHIVYDESGAVSALYLEDPNRTVHRVDLDAMWAGMHFQHGDQYCEVTEVTHDDAGAPVLHLRGIDYPRHDVPPVRAADTGATAPTIVRADAYAPQTWALTWMRVGRQDGPVTEQTPVPSPDGGFLERCEWGAAWHRGPEYDPDNPERGAVYVAEFHARLYGPSSELVAELTAAAAAGDDRTDTLVLTGWGPIPMWSPFGELKAHPRITVYITPAAALTVTHEPGATELGGPGPLSTVLISARTVLADREHADTGSMTTGLFIATSHDPRPPEPVAGDQDDTLHHDPVSMMGRAAAAIGRTNQ
jgi:hypothetical protein